MSVISQLVVKSKYSSIKSLLSKDYEFSENKKIIDVIVHAEKLLNIMYTAFPNFIEIKIIIGIYFIYYRENAGVREPCSFFAEEPISIRIYRNEFKPILYGFDFSSGEFAPYIRNIKAKYDIDMDCKCISIDISALVVVNLVEENSIVLEERIINNEDDEMEDFDEVPLSSVALGKDYYGADIKNYTITLGEISKAINQKIIEIEEESQSLKKEIEKLREDINKKNHKYLSLNDKFNDISKEYSKQTEKLKSLENRYLKEQRRTDLLETENTRKIEEIKQLNNEKNELLSNIEKNKFTIKDKLKQLIAGK
jgi:hypothetical protein